MQKDYTNTFTAIVIASCVLFFFLVVRSYPGGSRIQSDGTAGVIVEVKGDVPKPGIYMVDGAGVNVAAVAARAGFSWGILPALGSRKLVSGQSLDVLRHGEEVTIRFRRMPGAALLACGLKLDLNSASLDELLLIPRMRPQVANSILERRRERPWKKVDDLTEIRGVGAKTVERFQDYLEVSAFEFGNEQK